MAELCRRTGALLIVDEVVTGFGRTGRMFGCEHWDIRPDIMVMAKGISSGYVPMGAVAVTARVNEVFRDRPLLHLNTFAGHPVACAAAEATLDILERERLVENAARLEPVLRRELETCGLVCSRGRARLGHRPHEQHRGRCIEGRRHTELRAASSATRPTRTILLVRVNPDGTRVSVFFYPPLNVTKEDIVTGVKGLETALLASFASL